MFRIDNTTAVPTLPLYGPPGSAGYFTDGNPAAALEATIVDAWWANTVQEEIITVIAQSGLQLNKSSNSQLYEALTRLFMPQGEGPDVSGFLPLTGGTLSRPGTHDPLVIQADTGFNARIFYVSVNTRTWLAGCGSDGNFTIYDATIGQHRLICDLSGRVNINSGDLLLARSDQPQGWILRPDVPGFKNLSFGVPGGGPLENFNVSSTQMTVSGLLSVSGDLTCASSVHVGNVIVGPAGGVLAVQNGLNVLAGGASITGNVLAGGDVTAGFVTASNNITGVNLIATAAIWQGGAPPTIGAISGEYLLATGNVTAGGAIRQGAAPLVANAISGENLLATGYARIPVIHGGQANNNLDVYGGLVVHRAADAQVALVTEGDIQINGLLQGPPGGLNVYGGMIIRVVESQLDAFWNYGNLRVLGGMGYQPGGGVWLSSTAEARFQKDIEPYDRGLAAIRQLRPIVYRLTGTGEMPDDNVYHGLAAEDAGPVMPELFGQSLIKLRVEDAEAVPVTTYNGTALTYALVNAVKELADKIDFLQEALEAAGPVQH